MTTLPSQHPTVSLHLTDVTLTPLITSSSSPSHLESLTSLAHSALTSQAATQRVNLGRPQRIMIEYPDRGAVVLQSYLDPRDSPPPLPPTPAFAPSALGQSPSGELQDPSGPGQGRGGSRLLDGDTSRQDDAAPMLIGVVVAGSANDAREARRAAARLEQVGREFQREWAAEDAKTGLQDDSE